jgi:hypothetical protein
MIEAEIRPPQGTISQVTNPAGYLFTHEANDSFVALNRLVQGGDAVYWLSERISADGKSWPVGTHYVSTSSSTLPRLQQLAQDIGLNFQAVSRAPDSAALRLRPTRIGLWDRHGGSTSSGWTRFVLEQFEFPHTVALADSFAEGRLSEKFDVIIFVDDAMDTPSVTADLAAQLRTFLDDGGTVLAIGGSTALGYSAGLPMTNALIEVERGRTQPLPQTKFYVPGSILQARVDTDHPIGYGFSESVDFFFDRSPAFRLNSNASDRGTRPIAWFDSATPLRSGWAWGQNYLKDTVAVLEAQVGRGKLVLYGPEILFRAQPHGTFKFLFNGIYAARAERTELGE